MLLDQPVYIKFSLKKGNFYYKTLPQVAVKYNVINYRIPNLQFDLFTINGYHASTEFHTNGEIMHRLKSFVCELKQETGFSNT